MLVEAGSGKREAEAALDTNSLPAVPPESELYVAGPEPTDAEHAAEIAHAKRLAERYRLEFVDLSRFSIDHELFRAIPIGAKGTRW